MARLTGQSIAAGVVDFDAVYLDGAIWRLADASHYPGGVYIGDGEVVTDGSLTDFGSYGFDIVFAPVVEGGRDGTFRLVDDADDSPHTLELWGRTVDEAVDINVDALDRTPGAYGSLLETILVGRVIPLELAQSEARREIRRALMQHPAVDDIRGLTVDLQGDDAGIDFEVVAVDGAVIGGTLVNIVDGLGVDTETIMVGGDGSISVDGGIARTPGLYGTALETLLIGRTIPGELAVSEISREIRRALIQHPEVKEILKFDISLTDDDAALFFTVETTTGETITAGA
jgi:hypothetical protein